MGIELHPKFLSLTEPRRYQPLRESIVAKCCHVESQHLALSEFVDINLAC